MNALYEAERIAADRWRRVQGGARARRILASPALAASLAAASFHWWNGWSLLVGWPYRRFSGRP